MKKKSPNKTRTQWDVRTQGNDLQKFKEIRQKKMKKQDCRDQKSNENEEENHHRHRGYKSNSTKIRYKPSKQ